MKLNFSSFMSNEMKIREFYKICSTRFIRLQLHFNMLISLISKKNGLICTFNMLK